MLSLGEWENILRYFLKSFSVCKLINNNQIKNERFFFFQKFKETISIFK